MSMFGTLSLVLWEEAKTPCRGTSRPFSGIAWLGMRCVEIITKFVAPNNLELFMAPIPVLARDLYLQVIKNYRGETMSVDEARNQVNETQYQVLLAKLPTAREPSKSATPLAVIDPKGKVPETPSTNQREIKLVKAFDTEPNKMKLLASAMPMVELSRYITVIIQIC